MALICVVVAYKMKALPSVRAARPTQPLAPPTGVTAPVVHWPTAAVEHAKYCRTPLTASQTKATSGVWKTKAPARASPPFVMRVKPTVSADVGSAPPAPPTQPSAESCVA